MDSELPHLGIIGDVGVDLVMGTIAGWPQVGTELILPHSELRAGGSAANSALVLRHLGLQAQLIASVGQDDLGRWLAEQLHGVQTQLQVCASATTVSVGLMHACGERNFFTTQGHLELMTPQHVLTHLHTTPKPGSLALMTGPFLLPGLRTAYPELLREVAARGYQIALDTGWPSQGWTESVRSEVHAWLQHCDHLLINELEAQSLANVSDIEPAMQQIAALMKPSASLVVKVGPRGALALQSGQLSSHQIEPSKVFDSIGAGDTFNAGYLAARLRGADLPQALATGCRVARAILPRFPRGTIRPGEFAACIHGSYSSQLVKA
ncbi:carbohydrate kinase family protein [Roseateles sp.]|uniref:carbohydrate kinase family protein n=1 Tax=Roseateles sp. TaxID=1971397 RepID=UPI003D0E7C7F